MSDTPEADNERFNGVEDGCGMPDVVTYEFAQKLERERNEARAERDEWIARFRADEQLIKESMIPHPENPET